MSMPTTLMTADPDDFRQWEAEFGPADVEPLTGPKIPAQRSRAADKVDAQHQIDEGYLEWRRTHGRGA